MSWGISKRLKRILGFSEDMNFGRSSEFSGSEKDTAFSSKDLTAYSRSLTPEQAAAGANNFWEKQKPPKETPVATADIPRPLTEINSDRKVQVKRTNEVYTRGD